MSANDARFRKALELHRMDEDQKAIEILSEPCFAEDPQALHLLGQIYFLADKPTTGVSRDPSKARKMWLRALELGSADAAYDLGKMYRFGDGVKESHKKCEEYWRIAVDSGETLAAFDLANLYYEDMHDKIDKAIELCTWLISKGEFLGNCHLILGRIHYRGIGAPVDLEQAFRWLEKGAALGHGNSCMDLAMMYYRGEFVEKNVARAIALVERAGETEWLKEEAPIIAEEMRKGTL